MSIAVPDLDLIIKAMNDVLASDPQASLASFRDDLQVARDTVLQAALVSKTQCKYCSHPIVLDELNRWMHLKPDEIALSNRECRAASFDRLGDWDDTLPRGVNARPA